jgi:hypothetical protein
MDDELGLPKKTKGDKIKDKRGKIKGEKGG